MSVSRRTLIERIDRFIGIMEKGHREPDDWEGQCMQQALADIALGDVPHAEAMMALAKTAREQRPSERPPGVPAVLPRPGVAELRERLQRMRQEPG